MSESKHTPGPWMCSPDSKSDVLYVVTDIFGDYLTIDDEEHDANAALIAAAPDLLAMLKVAQLWLDVDGRFDMQGINAVIAKAEGR